MGTVRDLVTMSLKKLGVVAAGETPQAHELNDGLTNLKLLVDSWALESVLIPVVSTITKPLTIGEVLYTIGEYPDVSPPDNHIETAIPIEYIAAFLRDSAGTDYFMTPVNTVQYSQISVKSSGARPSDYYIEDGWPLTRLILNAQPYAADTLYLKVKQNFNTLLPLSSLDDVVSLPDGFEQALVYNLAMQIASDYGQSVQQDVAFTAVQSKNMIKSRYSKQLVSRVDRGLQQNRRNRGTYNIYSGP